MCQLLAVFTLIELSHLVLSYHRLSLIFFLVCVYLYFVCIYIRIKYNTHSGGIFRSQSHDIFLDRLYANVRRRLYSNAIKHQHFVV